MLTSSNNQFYNGEICYNGNSNNDVYCSTAQTGGLNVYCDISRISCPGVTCDVGCP